MRLLSSSREDLLVLLTSSYSQASQVALAVKNPPANAGDLRVVGSIPDSGRSPGGGHSTPLQYSCLGTHGQRSLMGYNPWDRKRVGHDLETKQQQCV